MVVGYLNWRRSVKGRVVPEKILRDHRDKTLASPNNQDVLAYKWTLLKEIPLDEVEWELRLSALEKRYPAPELPNAAQ